MKKLFIVLSFLMFLCVDATVKRWIVFNNNSFRIAVKTEDGLIVSLNPKTGWELFSKPDNLKFAALYLRQEFRCNFVQEEIEIDADTTSIFVTGTIKNR